MKIFTKMDLLGRFKNVASKFWLCHDLHNSKMLLLHQNNLNYLKIVFLNAFLRSISDFIENK